MGKWSEADQADLLASIFNGLIYHQELRDRVLECAKLCAGHEDLSQCEVVPIKLDVPAFLLGRRRILTCVYCGVEYPQDTPAAGSDVLTAHIKVCEKHPLRAAEAEIADLQAKLAQAQKELAEARAALEQISAWDGFPSSGMRWPDGERMSYGAAFGSNGERDFMRSVVAAALIKKVHV